MHDDRSHPLLQQIPLTVSPFLSLPTPTNLPYTYKPLPSTLPESVIDTPTSVMDVSQPQQPLKPQYVISPTTHHAAHPDDIIASCRALQEHIQKMQDEGRQMVEKWQQERRERELAEKRRVAPGWLDVDEQSRLLVPERKAEPHSSIDLMSDVGQEVGSGADGLQAVTGGVQRLELDGNSTGVNSREGDELDRAFGGPT